MPKSDKGVVKRIIVTPDKHFPLHDQKAINCVKKTIEIVKPESNPKVWLSVGGYFAVALLFFILINRRLAFKA